MPRQSLPTWLAGLLLAGAAHGQQVEPAPVPTRLLLVGDSTMAPRTGYGDALCRRFVPAGGCLNLARGGRSSGSFRAEGLWDTVLAHLRDGRGPAWVLIQFGHNDQPGKPGRSTDLATEFPANLQRYVAEVRAAGSVPVLLTPLTRRRFHDGRLLDDLAPWAETTRAVASAQAVPLVDLHRDSARVVQALGEAAADTLAEAPPGQPRFDHTHLGPAGACLFAGLVLQALLQVQPAAHARFDTVVGSCGERQ